MLGEVEVVAYGVQKKVSVTGAISSVKGEELTKTPTGSISNMLSGQMAGLTTVQYSGEPGSDAANIFCPWSSYMESICSSYSSRRCGT